MLSKKPLINLQKSSVTSFFSGKTLFSEPSAVKTQGLTPVAFSGFLTKRLWPGLDAFRGASTRSVKKPPLRWNASRAYLITSETGGKPER